MTRGRRDPFEPELEDMHGLHRADGTEALDCMKQPLAGVTVVETLSDDCNVALRISAALAGRIATVGEVEEESPSPRGATSRRKIEMVAMMGAHIGHTSPGLRRKSRDCRNGLRSG